LIQLCAWTRQQLLRHSEGVLATRTGFVGGVNENPTEEDNGGHAEVDESAVVGCVTRGVACVHDERRAHGSVVLVPLAIDPPRNARAPVRRWTAGPMPRHSLV
jgi:hypothetical protein